MKNRILTIINLEKISAAQMASLLGIQRSTLSNIIGGRNKPSYDILNSILTKFPNLNFEWLMNGKGNPYKDPDKNLRGENLFSEPVENLTKEPERLAPTPEDDSMFKQPDEDDFAGDAENDLFSYTPHIEEVNNDFPVLSDEKYHHFPNLEEGELAKRAEMLQKSKNESIIPDTPASQVRESSVKPEGKRIAEENKEKKIERIQIFYSDGTFEEFKR